MELATTPTRFFDIKMFDRNGTNSIPLRYEARFRKFIKEDGPFYNLLKIAANFWNE